MRHSDNRLTAMQLELLKSFKHIVNEKDLNEVKALLNLYFRHRLDAAIDTEEQTRNLTATVYDEWLRSASK